MRFGKWSEKKILKRQYHGTVGCLAPDRSVSSEFFFEPFCQNAFTFTRNFAGALVNGPERGDVVPSIVANKEPQHTKGANSHRAARPPTRGAKMGR